MSENEYEFVSEDNMINYFKKRRKVVVKREDLQLLYNHIDWNFAIEFDEDKKLERIKEEYRL